jgi:hypothetical protein
VYLPCNVYLALTARDGKKGVTNKIALGVVTENEMSTDVHLYLKYFHKDKGGGKNLEEVLNEVETENTGREKGIVDETHIDSLRID